MILPQPKLINLRRRPDRLASALVAARAAGIEPQVIEACDDVRGWVGCRASHLRLWREAIDKNETIWVIEDDVTFADDFQAKVAQLDIPDDWDFVYLGGVHRGRVVQQTPYLVRTTSVGLTTSYVARPAALARALEYVDTMSGHIDIVWSGRHVLFNIYAPTTWLNGQVSGFSDITGAWREWPLLQS